KIVLEPFIEIGLVVEDALQAIAEVAANFPVLLFLEEESARSGGLEDAEIRLAVHGTVVHDPGPGQEILVVRAEHSLPDHHAIMIAEPGQAAQPREALTLHCRMKVAHKEQIDVALARRPR